MLKKNIVNVWNGHGFPSSWRKGIINPIFKKGDDSIVNNYRGITLMNTEYKLYAMVLGERLRREVETILPDSQSGFRRGRSGMENIYLLNFLVDREIHRKGKLVAFFVDLRAAFDTLDREILRETMEMEGIGKGLIQRVQEIYKETVNVVKTNEGATEKFWTKKGVRQGCPMSPTLFSLYVADVEKFMSMGQTGGVVIGKEKIWSMAYADDMVLLAKSEWEMKEMIKRFEKYIKKKKMILNVEKSKIVVFKKGRRGKNKEEWIWDGAKIEETSEFKYLGFTFIKNGHLMGHIKEITKRATVAMKKIWGIGENIFKENYNRRMMMFDYLVKSIILYGVEIWGWKEYQEFEGLQERYLRWILRLDKTTPGYLVREETKRSKLRIEAGLRAYKFEEKIRKSNNKYILDCIAEIDKTGNEEKGWGKTRRDYFRRLGWSTSEIKKNE